MAELIQVRCDRCSRIVEARRVIFTTFAVNGVIVQVMPPNELPQQPPGKTQYDLCSDCKGALLTWIKQGVS